MKELQNFWFLLIGDFRKLFKIIFILVFIISSRGLNLAYAETEIYWTRSGKNVEVLSGSILVRFKEYVSDSVRSAAFKSIGAKRVGGIDRIGIDKVNVPADKTVSEMVDKFSLRDDVLYAEPIFIRRAFSYRLPDIYSTLNELENRQWGLAKIDAPGGWAIATGTAVVVAVLDTGIDLNHNEFVGNIWNNLGTSFYKTYISTDGTTYNVQFDTHGWDFVNHDNDPSDDYGHGTHVAGIIGANSISGSTVVGVGWNIDLMAVKVLGADGRGYSLNIINGIIYAADRGANVINMSFGGYSGSQAERDAVNYAYNKGVVLVAAVGNSGNPEIFYPAAYENVIAVGATDRDDFRARFSNYGAKLDVVAPGVDIYSTIINGYAYMSGTSMAASFVSGLAALIISYWEQSGKNPIWMPRQVKNIIIANCDDINNITHPRWDKYMGYGRINVKKTLASKTIAVDDKKTIVYPNPFNPDLESAYIVLPTGYDGAARKLRIYSLTGQLVRETAAFGGFATWDGRNNKGEICATGLYFFYLDTTTGSKKGKITLIR